MDLGVRGRGYVLVGASRGMGLAVARALASEGANIAIISRADNRAIANGLAAEFSVNAIGISGDATDAESIDRAIGQAVALLGGVRGLLTASAERKYGTLLDAADEDWKSCFESVVMGTVRSCRAVVPHMIKGGGGTIVTMAAYSARCPKPYIMAYAAAKAAVVNITKNLARGYGEHGIRANCVCPGIVETARTRLRLEKLMAQHGISHAAASRMDIRNMKMDVSLQRVGQPQEVAHVIALLLSERAGYTSGATINVDGGTDF
jgi:3-oxoacyl-[acyl-carrier protein] reductase